MTTGAPVVLAYGNRRPGHRRRQMLAMATAVVALAAGVVAHRWPGRWVPAVRHRWDLYQLSRAETRAMAFDPPPGQVVFSDGAATANPNVDRIRSDCGPVDLWHPPPWRDFLDRAATWNPATRDVTEYYSPGLSRPSAAGLAMAPALLCGRTMSDGTSGLLCVAVTVKSGSIFLEGFCWTAGSPRAPPVLVPNSQLRITTQQPLTIYAARFDPSDPTHFTIVYRISGRLAAVHGRTTPTGVLLAGNDDWCAPDALWVRYRDDLYRDAPDVP